MCADSGNLMAIAQQVIKQKQQREEQQQQHHHHHHHHHQQQQLLGLNPHLLNPWNNTHHSLSGSPNSAFGGLTGTGFADPFQVSGGADTGEPGFIADPRGPHLRHKCRLLRPQLRTPSRRAHRRTTSLASRLAHHRKSNLHCHC
jgi:hypothetical protein